MASWDDFRRQAPDLADGAPRLTGLEVHFGEGELWLAMMPGSRKADDLRRDPRFSLHSAPDLSMVDGDAKVGGRAVPVADEPTITRFVNRLPEELPSSGMGLFRADLADASLARVEGDFMVIDVWTDGEAPRQVRRQ